MYAYVRTQSSSKQEAEDYKNTPVRMKYQQRGGRYRNMTPTDTNSDFKNN